MKGLSVIAAAVMLTACASKGTVRPPDDTAAEYQRIADNASQHLICKRQAVLGTRVDSLVCVTPEDLKAQRENAADVMRDIQANTPINNQPTPPTPPPVSSPAR